MSTKTRNIGKPVISLDNPPAGAVPATVEQLLALGIPQSSIDAGKHGFDMKTVGPWSIVRNIRAIVERAEFGEFSRKTWVEFYPMRTMYNCRESGYAMEGRVSVGGVKCTCFTSSILFELPNGKLVDVAVIFAR